MTSSNFTDMARMMLSDRLYVESSGEVKSDNGQTIKTTNRLMLRVSPRLLEEAGIWLYEQSDRTGKDWTYKGLFEYLLAQGAFPDGPNAVFTETKIFLANNRAFSWQMDAENWENRQIVSTDRWRCDDDFDKAAQTPTLRTFYKNGAPDPARPPVRFIKLTNGNIKGITYTPGLAPSYRLPLPGPTAG